MPALTPEDESREQLQRLIFGETAAILIAGRPERSQPE
jgi:hypothetical protein